MHHIKPSLHWSEMAQWYDDHKDEFARNDAIVFDGIRDNQEVWFLLMTKNHRRLAECMVDFHGRSVEERVELIQSRLHRRLSPVRSVWQLEQRHEFDAPPLVAEALASS